MIRPAKKSESQQLTAISFASKGYWKYPEEYFDIWKDELTILPEYIEENLVYIYECNGKIRGYYSIIELKKPVDISTVKLPKGFWLEHMFVSPRNIGQGIGSKLFQHINQTCCSKGILQLGILVDPNSKGFYEKMGCHYQREIPSTIPNRTTPWYVQIIQKHMDKSQDIQI